MPPIIVAGVTNLETSAPVEVFPVDYAKSRFVFHGVRDRPGGVGFNVARALAHLGAGVEVMTLLGDDLVGEVLARHLATIDGLGTQAVVRRAGSASCRSVVLVEQATGRAAMMTDLKDSQDTAFPIEVARPRIEAAARERGAVFHATTINWALPLAHEAKRAGLVVSTDVQAIRSLDDAYNRRFMEVADVVFFSGENLGDATPRAMIEAMWRDLDVAVAVCTLAERGAIVGDRATGLLEHEPAIALRAPRNVTGAGDAFAAGFLAAFAQGASPREATLHGQLVAGWRVGEEGAGHGLPPRDVLAAEYAARRGGLR